MEFLYGIMGLVLPLIGIGIVVYIITRASSKGRSEKSEEEDAEMLKNIYTYLVLFATLMMSIGGSVGVFMGVADYIAPQPYVETFEQYQSSGNYDYDYDYDNNAPTRTREDYDIMVKDEYAQERRGAVRLLIQSVGWIAVPLPIFMYYQKDIRDNNNKGSAIE